jgi:glutamyl-tRNA reductase
LQAAGLKALTVVHPDPRRAEATARAFGCHAAVLEPLVERLAAADVVLASLGQRRRAVSTADVKEALRLRRRRPIFLIDAAVPGDIDPAVNDLDGAFLYTLDDLERVAMRGRAGREQEADRARKVLEDEVRAFLEDRLMRTAVPALADLRRAFEDARAGALKDAGGDADKATRLLVNRLLHAPTSALRALALRPRADFDIAAAERALKELFRETNGAPGKDDKS